MRPLVSIVIPTYNRAHVLAHTLDSVLAQTWTDWEAIVIDDGSGDGTAELLTAYCAKDPRIRCLRQENRGVSAARNRGLGESRGEFVAFLDSDDVWEPWKLETQMNAFRAFPDAVLCWTDMAAISRSGDVVSPSWLRKLYGCWSRYSLAELFDRSLDLAAISPVAASAHPDGRVYCGHIFHRMITGNLVHTSSVVLRASCLSRVGSFRESWSSGEDYHFFIRVCREGPVVFLDIPGIRYRVGEDDQLSGSAYHLQMSINFLLTVREMIDKHRDRLNITRNVRKQTLAYAHRWVGEEMLLAGDREGGVEHLRHSLMYRKDGRVLLTLARALLPPPVDHRLRSLYRLAGRVGSAKNIGTEPRA